MSIEDVFNMEFGISQGFMDHGEFFEGVRALLIDKDKSPKWTHKSIDEVTEADVKLFFDRHEKQNLDILKY